MLFLLAFILMAPLFASWSHALDRTIATGAVVQLTVKSDNGGDVFKIFEVSNTFRLDYHAAGAKSKTRFLTQAEGDALRTEAVRVLWNSKYRQPASARVCREFMTLSVGAETSEICAQNRPAAGPAYGLLLSLRALTDSPGVTRASGRDK